MMIARNICVAAFAATVFATPALAQEAAFALPEQCKPAAAAGGMDHAAMGHSSGGHSSGGHSAGGHGTGDMAGTGDMDLATMPEHVQENMRKMMITMPAMQEGMMMEDADIAFACGMIAHHQGAIDMAQVLLDHGDDPQMRALASEIISAQVVEIVQMTIWLTENAR